MDVLPRNLFLQWLHYLIKDWLKGDFPGRGRNTAGSRESRWTYSVSRCRNPSASPGAVLVSRASFSSRTLICTLLLCKWESSRCDPWAVHQDELIVFNASVFQGKQNNIKFFTVLP